VDGTLGRATRLSDVAIDMHGAWVNAPLGGASRLLLGRDAGLRGQLNASADLLGTVGTSSVRVSLELANARRAEFVPAHALSLKASCQATSSNQFHSFSGIECHWPPAGTADVSLVVLAASVPDIRHPEFASAQLTLPALPAATLVDWIRVLTPRLPDGLEVAGTIAGSIAYAGVPSPGPRVGTPSAQPWSGELVLSGGTLSAPELGPNPVNLGEAVLRDPLTGAESSQTLAPKANRARPAPSGGGRGPVFLLMPMTLPLGATEPAKLEGRFDGAGYTLQLTGSGFGADLLQLGKAIPAFGDGIEECLEKVGSEKIGDASPYPGQPGQSARQLGQEAPRGPSNVPLRLELSATRAWGGPQVWRDLSSHSELRPGRGATHR
jgi:AsmA protein